MPTFNNPRQVIVTEGGSGELATIAAVLVIAAVISAEAVLIEHVIQAILVTAVTALAGSSAVLARVLRRTGVWVVWRPPVLTGRMVHAIPAPRSRAIPAARRSAAALPAAACVPVRVTEITEAAAPVRAAEVAP
jgi:hypothetical protein